MDQLIPAQDSEVFCDEVCEGIHELIRLDTRYNTKAKTLLTAVTIFHLLQNVTMYIPPQVPMMLISDRPPSIGDFLALLSVAALDKSVWRSHFMVYLIVMGKAGCRYLIYVGSAASIWHGFARRIQDYLSWYQLPKWVRHFLNQGYEIILICPLVLFKMDDAVLTPEFNAFRLAIEGVFTYRFWAVYQSPMWSGEQLESKHYLSRMCPWPIADLEYGGLTSHSPTSEGIKDLEMLSMDQLVQLAEVARQKQNEKMREFRRAMMEARDAAAAGKADLSDPVVQFLLQKWETTAANKAVYDAARYEDFLLGRSLLDKAVQDPNWIPNPEEKNLMDAAVHRTQERNKHNAASMARQREDVRNGKPLLLLEEANELPELDSDDQRRLERARADKRRRKDYHQKKSDGRKLLKQFADKMGPGGLTAYVPNKYESSCLQIARSCQKSFEKEDAPRKAAAAQKAETRLRDIDKLTRVSKSATRSKKASARMTRGRILLNAVKYNKLDPETLSSEDKAIMETVQGRLGRINEKARGKRKAEKEKEQTDSESYSDFDVSDEEGSDGPEAMDLD